MSADVLLVGILALGSNVWYADPVYPIHFLTYSHLIPYIYGQHQTMEYEQLILAATENWAHYGYLGLLAGSFLSALFIPLGADILYVALLANGFNPWICLIIATIGGWLGGLVIYTIGYAGNTQRSKNYSALKKVN